MAIVFGDGFAISEPVHGRKGVTNVALGDEKLLWPRRLSLSRDTDEPGLGAIV